MIKIIGACLIISSVIVLSMIPIYHSKLRMKILRDFVQDFRYVHNELNSNLSSVPDLMAFLTERGGEVTKSSYSLIQQRIDFHGAALFHEDWCDVMKQYITYLSSDEFEQVLHIGNVLGKYILDEQLSALNNLIESLEESYLKERAFYSEKKRVYLGVGTSVGVVLVILLI